jgi:hypothetical protein
MRPLARLAATEAVGEGKRSEMVELVRQLEAGLCLVALYILQATVEA